MTQHSSLFEKFTHASSLDMQTLVSDLSTCSQPALNVRTILEDSKQVLDQLYLANEDIRQLIEVKSKLMDYILKGLWARFGFDQHVSLIAVGGYGRGELQPHSDIDLLILVRNEINDQLGTKLSDFITLLWDLKLDIGHSVRTIDECIEAAKSDVTIATNLLETRTIDGDPELLSIISDKVYSDAVYTSKAYFLAKREEQSARHLKYSGTEYNLEPNLKLSLIHI